MADAPNGSSASMRLTDRIVAYAVGLIVALASGKSIVVGDTKPPASQSSDVVNSIIVPLAELRTRFESLESTVKSESSEITSEVARWGSETRQLAQDVGVMKQQINALQGVDSSHAREFRDINMGMATIMSKLGLPIVPRQEP